MGFLRGIIVGIAASAAAAAWYLSRSGSEARDQLQLERRLGDIGDQFERRARELQQQVNVQIAEMQGKAEQGWLDAGMAPDAPGEMLDAAKAGAAETAASAEADAETVVANVSGDGSSQS